MEIINNIQINNSNLNTARDNDLEIIKRIDSDYRVAEEIIQNIYGYVNKNGEIHISFPLIVSLRDSVNRVSRIDRSFSIKGLKGVFGFSDILELNVVFDILFTLRWILTNFPLADQNTWIVDSDFNITYHKIEESIKIFEYIGESVNRSRVYRPRIDNTHAIAIDNIYLLIEIANDNLNSFFYETVMYELNVLLNIINLGSDQNDLFWQLLKIQGLYHYIEMIAWWTI
jgi:hypothetical protein